jgi:hypothetical protein
MRLVHRIGFRPSLSQLRELKALGVDVPAGTLLPGQSTPLVAFDVPEEGPNWRKLSSLFDRWGVFDAVTTEFTMDEIDAARWLDLVPDWHHGYPQPKEHDFGYRKVTYDLTDACEQCGIGMKQKAPFQMKGEPKWGRRGILQLNWIFDEYFVKPEVWSSVFEPLGIACRPVTDRRGAELKNVVQILVQEEVAIVTEELTPERCDNCGRIKYLPFTRGFFPAPTREPMGAIVKTREYFGSGAAAHKRVLVSQELRRALVGAGVRGASYWPVWSTNSGR